MSGGWKSEGPAVVGRHIQSRNRVALIATIVVLVVVAVLEALIPDVSNAVLDLQYAVGDGIGADPAGVFETGNGTVSWGLYLAVLLGTLAGLVAGTLGAARRYPILSGLSLRDYI